MFCGNPLTEKKKQNLRPCFQLARAKKTFNTQTISSYIDLCMQIHTHKCEDQLHATTDSLILIKKLGYLLVTTAINFLKDPGFLHNDH